MKVKLKEGEKLSSNQNYCNLDMETWIALNQGKQVELDSVPELIKNQVDMGGHKVSKKGDK